ncbi:hypothetical protein AGR7B_pAt0332 [Agrobacterium deltaense RV3]|nr:hypothetical protein AGR7B_pAt0332 [Agrobacterium deltaense RV3]
MRIMAKTHGSMSHRQRNARTEAAD